MLSIFMILIVISGFGTVYLETKNKHGGEKIFYTFYLFVMSTIILPFLGIFDSFIAYLIFFLFYLSLLYSIYTNFELFMRINEMLLLLKKIDKKQILKIDYEFLDILLSYYRQLIFTFTIKSYKPQYVLLDRLLLFAGVLFIIILLSILIIWNVNI